MASKNIDDYFHSLPDKSRIILDKMRKVIRASAPDSVEMMSYGVPAFTLNGRTILYAIFKEHIGLYPTPGTINAFKDELKGFETSKGTIKFPLKKPIPYTLIKKMVKYHFKL